MISSFIVIDNYKNMIQLHKKNPNLKILLAIGGWNEGSQSYSVLASSPGHRSKFIDSVVKFLGYIESNIKIIYFFTDLFIQ